MTYELMALLHESLRMVAVMLRLMLERCCRMSYHCTMTVSSWPFNHFFRFWLTCAFQMSSLVFMASSEYPRRLC